MKKLLITLAACLSLVAVVSAANVTVDTGITLAAVGSTNTLSGVTVGEWCDLDSLHIAFPPNSTSTVSFYSVNGTAEWQIGATMYYTNATAATVTQSYYPRKEWQFINANLSTNIVLQSYPVKGNIKYILLKTGATSQTYKPVFLLKR